LTQFLKNLDLDSDETFEKYQIKKRLENFDHELFRLKEHARGEYIFPTPKFLHTKLEEKSQYFFPCKYFNVIKLTLSLVFKKGCHQADLEPNAQRRYKEMLQMYDASHKYAKQFRTLRPQLMFVVSIAKWLDLKSFSEDNDEDLKDLLNAVVKLSPFFLPSFKNFRRRQKLQRLPTLEPRKTCTRFS